MRLFLLFSILSLLLTGCATTTVESDSRQPTSKQFNSRHRI